MGVIERWVEQGEAPKQIIAEHSKVVSSIADGHCVCIYKWRVTKEPAASMRLRQGLTHESVLIQAAPPRHRGGQIRRPV